MTTLVMHFKQTKKEATVQATWLDVVMPADTAVDIETAQYYARLSDAFSHDYEEISDDGRDDLDVLLSEAARL